MAYTFGANINDGIAYTGLPVSLFNANRLSLVTCWVRPTTLTTNRILWAQSNTSGVVVDTVTTDVSVVADTATNDGIWTAPVGLAVNTWTFVALLLNLGGTAVGACKAWKATESTGPVEVTVTTTQAPTGAYQGGGTGFTIGNALSGGSAFQGDIGGVAVFPDSTNSNLNSICGIAANGALSQAQADLVRASFVDPLWRGDILRLAGQGRMVRGTSGFGFGLSASLDSVGATALRANSAPTAGTITSATFSTLRTPHSFDDNPANQWNARRSGVLVRA